MVILEGGVRNVPAEAGLADKSAIPSHPFKIQPKFRPEKIK
jgi:hypothetical protein